MGTYVRTFRLRVATRGATDVAGNVDYTLQTEITDIPTIPGPVARPLEGKTETAAWTLRVLDANNVLTSRIADGDGRLHQLGRLADFQMSEDDGATWSTLYTGRIAGLSEAKPGVWDVRLADERWLERRARVFTAADTTMVWPVGIRYAWRSGARTVAKTQWPLLKVLQVDAGTRLVLLRTEDVTTTPEQGALIPPALEFIRDDRRGDTRASGEGNYKTLRLRVGASTPFDCEVWGFDTRSRLSGWTPLSTLDETLEPGKPIPHIWVLWPDGETLPVALVSSYRAHLYAPTHEPTDALPLHVGVQDASHTWGASTPGLHPLAAVRTAYEQANVRHDTSAFAALEADASYLLADWRIKAPEKVAAWAERKVYKPTLVLPFIDNQGRIAPKSLVPPQGLDPDALFVFDASNVKEPYPTFDVQDGEVANVIEAEYDAVRPTVRGAILDYRAMDGMDDEREEAEPIKSDAVAADPPLMGERAVRFDLSGWYDAPAPEAATDPLTGVVVQLPGLTGLALASTHARLARYVLDRFADGPILQVVYGTEDTSSVQAGDWVLIDQDSLKGPNPATNARSGKRLVQVMKRDILPIGYRYEVLDAGPNLQPLTAPTLSVAQNASEPKHAIDVTIANLPTGATALVEVAYDSGFTRIAHVRAGLADGTHTIRPLASGRTLYVRARATKVARIQSAVTATETVATDALTAPTVGTATASGRTIRLDVTPGEDDYPLMPVLDGADYLPTPLPAGTDTLVFEGLDASTLYTVGVKHVDPWGGESSVASTSETTGTSTQLAAPRRLRILQGRSDAAEASGLLGLIRFALIGLEVGFIATERHATHRVQVSTDSSFAGVDFEVTVPPGQETARILTPLKTDLLYVRVRAERDGWTDSAWSTTVSAYATRLAEETPTSDRFPGGWAFLSVAADGTVSLEIGSDDADTDRAYYEVSTSAYPSVDTADSFVERSSLPASIDPGITLSAGQTAYATVRFWNQVSGFGQSVRHAIGNTGPASAENLMGPGAGDEVSSSGSSFNLQTVTLSEVGLREGQLVSASAEIKSATGADRVRLRLRFRDAGGSDITTYDTDTQTTATYTTFELANKLIPSGTVFISLVSRNEDVTESASSRAYMLVAGPVVLPFREPIFRLPRDTVDDVSDGSTYARTRAAYLSDGKPAKAVSTFAIEDTSGTFGALRHTETGQAQDGDPVTFARDYEGVPSVTFIPQVALVYDTGSSASDLYVDMQAENPTSSSFDMRAKLTTSQSATAISDGFSSSQNTAAPENSDVILGADGAAAYCNLEDADTNPTTYKCYFDVNTTPMSATNVLTVAVYTNDGASSSTWTLRASRQYNSGENLSDEVLQFTASLGANYDIRMVISYDDAPGVNTAIVTAHGEDNAVPGVQYNVITPGTEQPMTPGTSDAVAYVAQEAP